jgi:hypothetical protein
MILYNFAFYMLDTFLRTIQFHDAFIDERWLAGFCVAGPLRLGGRGGTSAARDSSTSPRAKMPYGFELGYSVQSSYSIALERPWTSLVKQQGDACTLSSLHARFDTDLHEVSHHQRLVAITKRECVASIAPRRFLTARVADGFARIRYALQFSGVRSWTLQFIFGNSNKRSLNNARTAGSIFKVFRRTLGFEVVLRIIRASKPLHESHFFGGTLAHSLRMLF